MLDLDEELLLGDPTAERTIIRYKSDNVTFFFPITTSILVSLLLSIIFWIIHHMSR